MLFNDELAGNLTYSNISPISVLASSRTNHVSRLQALIDHIQVSPQRPACMDFAMLLAMSLSALIKVKRSSLYFIYRLPKAGMA